MIYQCPNCGAMLLEQETNCEGEDVFTCPFCEEVVEEMSDNEIVAELKYRKAEIYKLRAQLLSQAGRMR